MPDQDLQLFFLSLRKVVVALKPFLGVKSGNEVKPKEIRHTTWASFTIQPAQQVLPLFEAFLGKPNQSVYM